MVSGNIFTKKHKDQKVETGNHRQYSLGKAGVVEQWALL